MSGSTEQVQEHKPEHDHGRRTVTVKVFAPKEPDPKKFTWPSAMKVGAAAAEAAKAFGYEGGSPTFQNEKGVVLDREKSVIDAGVKHGDKLELVDAGGGV